MADQADLHREEPPSFSPKEADAIESARLHEATAREIAGKARPSRIWTPAGWVICLLGLLLVIGTWTWKGGSMGRYGFHPTLMSLGVVFLGVLMLRRGRGLE